MDWFEAVGYGSLGGFLVSLLRVGENYLLPKIRRPATFSDPLFYVYNGGTIFAGGALAFVVSRELSCLTPVLALGIGIAAPITIKAAFGIWKTVKTAEREREPPPDDEEQ